MELVQRPIDPEAALHLDVTSTTGASGTAEEVVNRLINDHEVIIFSKTTCAFCLELKRTLNSYGIQYAVYEADKSEKPISEIKAALKAISGIDTFPNLFIKGESKGGCMDLKRLEHVNGLLPLFHNVKRGETSSGRRVGTTGLFWFPDAVNRRSARVAGLLAMIICVLCVAFWKKPTTKWVVLALAIDFFIRIFFGGAVSIIGMLSQVIVSPWPPVYTAGPPKQFAAVCGWFMACVAAGLLLGGQRLGGTIVVGILIFPAALEGIFDFCLGCWMFGLAIQFKLLPPTVYRSYLNTYADKEWAYKFTHADGPHETVESTHVHLPGQTIDTPVDLIRKDRFEIEYKLRDLHPIKHARVDLYGAPLALAALAFCFWMLWKGNYHFPGRLRQVYAAIAITSVSLFGVISFLYLAKLILYPKKVLKEWRHPVTGNFFSAITICIVLYGIFMFAKDTNFGIAIVWIGSAANMLITVLRVSYLVFDRQADDLLNPSIMMPPVSNFICAIAFSMYSSEENAVFRDGTMNYIGIARLWFSVAALFAIALFVITLNKTFRDHHSEPRLRPTIFVWMATSGVAGLSYLAVNKFDPTLGHSLGFQFFWYITIFFYAINVVGLLRGFFNYVQDMSIWLYGFSFCALALSTIAYQMFVPDLFTKVLVYISLTQACCSVAVCGFHTTFWAIEGVLFRPTPKWGPASFMKITHEAFRFALPNLVNFLKTFNEQTGFYGVGDLVQQLDGLFVTYTQHGRHEEEIIFPVVRRYFPGLNTEAEAEHAHEHEILHRMMNAVAEYKKLDPKDPAAPNAMKALIKCLQAEFPDWSNHVLEHLRSEERTFSVAARKYIPIEIQKEMTDRVFTTTSPSDWEVIMPYVLKNLPMPNWKTQFIRTFIWAKPERAQEIGLHIYRTCDSVTYAQLADDIPEIVPRGASTLAWRRIY